MNFDSFIKAGTVLIMRVHTNVSRHPLYQREWTSFTVTLSALRGSRDNSNTLTSTRWKIQHCTTLSVNNSTTWELAPWNRVAVYQTTWHYIPEYSAVTFFAKRHLNCTKFNIKLLVLQSQFPMPLGCRWAVYDTHSAFPNTTNIKP